jgi:hypothetical protein
MDLNIVTIIVFDEDLRAVAPTEESLPLRYASTAG